MVDIVQMQKKIYFLEVTVEAEDVYKSWFYSLKYFWISYLSIIKNTFIASQLRTNTEDFYVKNGAQSQRDWDTELEWKKGEGDKFSKT